MAFSPVRRICEIRILLTVVLLFSMIISVSAGQSDSLAYIYRQDNLSSTNDLQLNYKIGFPNSVLTINDLLRYKVFSFENGSSQGEQYSIDHQFRSDWGWGDIWNKNLRFESSQYEDHRAGLASTISNLALLAGVKNKNKFALFAGGRSVERYGLIDEGWTAALNFNNLWQSGTQATKVQFNGDRDQLDKHLNHAIQILADYRVNFASISSFQTTLDKNTRSQSFFTDSSGSSQSRFNDNLQWRSQFTYNLGKDVKLFHRLNWGDQLTTINQKRVNSIESLFIRGEDRKRLSLSNESGLELKRSQFSSISTFKVENSQNKYYTDHTQIQYQLNEFLLWEAPGVVDTLIWNTHLSRMEYDTPDTTNDDDRDEWRFNTEVRFVWQPSPFYYLDVGSKLSLFHLLYLFNTRSSENHWNRNLVLWSGFAWHRADWEGEGKARIRSNYFDYDFDDLFVEMEQPTRSFIHRSLELQQQLSYQFSHRWSITSKIAARWEDEGQLNWDAFIQQVTSDREQIEFIMKLFYDYRGWKGWLGYLTHERTTNYALLSKEPQVWYGEGPLLGARHKLGERLFLDADARFISVVDQDREYSIPKVFVTLVYR